MMMSGEASKPAVLLVQDAAGIEIAPATDDSGMNRVSIRVGTVCIQLSPNLVPDMAQQLIDAQEACRAETRRWVDTVSSALAAYRTREDAAEAEAETEDDAEAVTAVIYSDAPLITSRSAGNEEDFDCIDIECASSGDGVTLFCADIDMDDFIDRLRREWDEVQERWDEKHPTDLNYPNAPR